MLFKGASICEPFTRGFTMLIFLVFFPGTLFIFAQEMPIFVTLSIIKPITKVSEISHVYDCLIQVD